MKICFLAPASNYHTKKWCKWFTEHGHEVHVVSFVDDKIENTVVHFINSGASVEDGDSQKLKYLFKARYVKKIVDKIRPDIVNVHYASSYGAVAALSGLRGYVLSLWGSDVYDFPNHSFLHRYLLQYSLKKAKYIFSTSQAMAKEAAKYTNKEMYITPFGVDMELFNPGKRNRTTNEFVIGTVKKLEPVYGIEYILQAVKMLKEVRPDMDFKVRIAGNGTHEEYYKRLAKELGVDSYISWLGFISQEKAAEEWANMDVAVIPSIRESYGVSAIEAQASGTPVIISDIDGLNETTKVDCTSFSVKVGDYEKIAQLIIYLYENQNIRETMEKHARQFVEKKYDLNNCFDNILDIYTGIMKKNHFY